MERCIPRATHGTRFRRFASDGRRGATRGKRRGYPANAYTPTRFGNQRWLLLLLMLMLLLRLRLMLRLLAVLPPSSLLLLQLSLLPKLFPLESSEFLLLLVR